MSEKVLKHKNISVEYKSDKSDVSVSAGSYISDLLSQYYDTPVLLLLAGGSSVDVLKHINPEYLTDLLTVTVTDERYSEELDENNFAILQSESFYNDLIQADSFCINTQVFQPETFEQFRARFEKNIKDWKADFPKGKIIALYGMGSDGHIAGIIPGVLDDQEFAIEYNSSNRLVGKMDATGKNKFPFRISTTFSFMKEWVDHTAMYVTGEEKKEALEKVLDSEKGDSSAYITLPASVIVDMKDVVVFTDIKI